MATKLETGCGEISQENWLRSANIPLPENTRQNSVPVALSGQLPAGPFHAPLCRPHFNWVRSAEMRSYASPFATCARVPPIGFLRKYYVAENTRQIGFELRGGRSFNQAGSGPTLGARPPLIASFRKIAMLRFGFVSQKKSWISRFLYACRACPPCCCCMAAMRS
jgi:hypothetical protein